MTVMQSHGFKYNVDCLRQLVTKCSLPLSTLNDIKVCVIISRKHPTSLDFEKSSGDNAHNPETVDAIKEAEKVSIDTGLDQFQLIPRNAAGMPKLSGLELFEHACQYRNTNVAAETKEGKQVRLAPAKGLDIALYNDSLECIQPTESELCRGAVIKG